MARVLVVDDDAGIRESAAIALEKSGHRVFRASSAAEARAILHDERIEAVVSDIYMPGEDGIELLRAVTASRNAPPVILMTARGTIETAAIAARVGAFDYIAKPFKVRDLIERVRSAVTPKTAAEPSAVSAPDSMIVGVHESMVRCTKPSHAWRHWMCRFSCAAKAGAERSSSRRRFTRSEKGPTSLSCRSTAARFPILSSKVSSSAPFAARSPMPDTIAGAHWSELIAARCSSTK